MTQRRSRGHDGPIQITKHNEPIKTRSKRAVREKSEKSSESALKFKSNRIIGHVPFTARILSLSFTNAILDLMIAKTFCNFLPFYRQNMT